MKLAAITSMLEWQYSCQIQRIIAGLDCFTSPWVLPVMWVSLGNGSVIPVAISYEACSQNSGTVFFLCVHLEACAIWVTEDSEFRFCMYTWEWLLQLMPWRCLSAYFANSPRMRHFLLTSSAEMGSVNNASFNTVPMLNHLQNACMRAWVYGGRKELGEYVKGINGQTTVGSSQALCSADCNFTFFIDPVFCLTFCRQIVLVLTHYARLLNALFSVLLKVPFHGILSAVLLKHLFAAFSLRRCWECFLRLFYIGFCWNYYSVHSTVESVFSHNSMGSVFKVFFFPRNFTGMLKV